MTTARHAARHPVLLAAALTAALAPPAAVPAQPADFFPVGVAYQPDADPTARRLALEEIRRLRFNVVALSERNEAGDTEVALVDRLLGGAADARTRLAGLIAIPPRDRGTAAAVTLAAWYAVAMGARGIVFGTWSELQQSPEGLTAAVEFADHMSRNAALYTQLRPRVAAGTAADVRVKDNDPRISARFLESDAALVLIATNHGAAAVDATLTFPPDTQEAIWTNMLTGVAVNFVAGPEGPFYTRTFAPQEVVVLMILKRLK